MMRSVPLREKTPFWMTTSSGVSLYSHAPEPAYSPSEFSRMNVMSTSSGLTPTSGQGAPGRSFTGRTFTYSSKPWRISSSSFRSEMWSGTPGNPTAPRKIASNFASVFSPSSGIMRPVFR